MSEVVANPTANGHDNLRGRSLGPTRPERDTLWRKVTAAMPGYADYQEQTDRVIPVVGLTRQ